MERYKSDNDIDMFATSRLNWKVVSTYKDGSGDELFEITIITDRVLQDWVYNPNSLILSTSNTHSEEELKFKVMGIEHASDIVWCYVHGMGVDISDTIYVIKNKV